MREGERLNVTVSKVSHSQARGRIEEPLQCGEALFGVDTEESSVGGRVQFPQVLANDAEDVLPSIKEGRVPLSS